MIQKRKIKFANVNLKNIKLIYTFKSHDFNFKIEYYALLSLYYN